MQVVQEKVMSEMMTVNEMKKILKSKEITSDAEIFIDIENQVFDIKSLYLSKCDCCDTKILILQCEERE